MLVIEHLEGVFRHAHPKSLWKLPHLQYEGNDTSRPSLEIRHVDVRIETLRFGDLDAAIAAERLADDAIYPEPSYG